MGGLKMPHQHWLHRTLEQFLVRFFFFFCMPQMGTFTHYSSKVVTVKFSWFMDMYPHWLELNNRHFHDASHVSLSLFGWVIVTLRRVRFQTSFVSKFGNSVDIVRYETRHNFVLSALFCTTFIWADFDLLKTASWNHIFITSCCSSTSVPGNVPLPLHQQMNLLNPSVVGVVQSLWQMLLHVWLEVLFCFLTLERKKQLLIIWFLIGLVGDGSVVICVT